MTAPGDGRPDGGQESYDQGSRVEAVEAVVHHLHHPGDPNRGIVRARLGKGAVVAGLLSAAVTTAAVVLLALTIGGN